MKIGNVKAPAQKRKTPDLDHITRIWIFNDEVHRELNMPEGHEAEAILSLIVDDSGKLSMDLSRMNFGGVDMEFHDLTRLKSWKRFPKSIGNLYADLDERSPIKTLDGSFDHVSETFRLSAPTITSLSGVGDRYLKSALEIVYDHRYITSHILGLLRVKGLQLVTKNSMSHFGGAHYPEAKISLAAGRIIQRRITAGDLDILAAQEELIDNDMAEFAQL